MKNLFTVLFCVLVFATFVTGCATTPTTPKTPWYGLEETRELWEAKWNSAQTYAAISFDVDPNEWQRVGEIGEGHGPNGGHRHGCYRQGETYIKCYAFYLTDMYGKVYKKGTLVEDSVRACCIPVSAEECGKK